MADYSVTSESENLRLQMRRMMDGLHVAMPAKVLAFQPGPPVRVIVQPTTQMKITLGEEVSYRSLPQLSGVPVVLPFAQTAGFLLTVPIQPGDTGLLVIPDRGLDNFLQAGDVAAPPFYGDPTLIQPRGHSLTDAIFIPGLSSDAAEIADYSTEAIELRDKARKSYISLGPDGITMTDGTAVMKMSGGKLETTAPTGISMQTDAQCTIRSQNMDLSGAGNTFSGDCRSTNGTFTDKDGVVLGTHTHEGVQTGAGTTGGPVK